jgi:hypothetical protein
MPQLWHFGILVCEFAVAGSKFEGMGLEKEHIGQTQVAFGPSVGVGATGRVWLCRREGVLEGE